MPFLRRFKQNTGKTEGKWEKLNPVENDHFYNPDGEIIFIQT